jgi:serine/threonine-protein kinase
VAEQDLVGTVIDGRYKVIEPIAEGAMGSVFRGERLQLGRAVAIKIMHQELPDELASRQRFEREAKLMALLEHPNCVSVIDFGVHDDKPFLVMDLVRGTSLIDLLEKSGPLDVAKATDIIRQVLSGLAHAHELGIVHRDIKPANIMLSEKAGLGLQVRILDFGLARLAEGSKATKLTTGIVVGTPNYMAPEQCKGGDIDARTDLYACGVMLFEMLTGRKPFLADDPLQVVRKHLLEPAPTLASVEPRIDFGELEGVVAKALAKAPGDRYDSAVAMSKAIEVAAAKQVKTSAAALFARAIPEGSASVGSQQATMSGWNVPQSESGPAPAGSGTQMLSDSMVLPNDSSIGKPVGNAATLQVQLAAPPPVAPPPLAPPPVTAAPSGLPALPQAAPYVPPAGYGAPAADAATHGSGPSSGAPVDVSATGADPAFTSNGTPGAPMVVPPTRPSTVQPTPPAKPAQTGASRPIPQLPLTRKQLMIAGGGLFALILIIAFASGGGDSKKKTATKPEPSAGSGSEVIEMEPEGGQASAVADKAKAMLDSEDYDGAVRTLRAARKRYPDNAEIAFLAGKAYFGQLYWTDGIDSFRAAIKLDASYRENPELIKTVLKGFLTTPDVDDRITSFMRRDIGLPMKKYLEETAEKHPNKALRARARTELSAK